MTTQTNPKIVTFAGYNCTVKKEKFQDGSICLSLFDADDGMPVAKASVSIEGIKVGENQTVIKNYAENEGIFQILVLGGIVSPIGAKIYEINNFGSTVVVADLLI